MWRFQTNDYTEVTTERRLWSTHMRAWLSGQKGGQGLSVPVVGIQIHKYDRPGAALESINTVREMNLSSLHRFNICPALIRGKKPSTAKWLHSKPPLVSNNATVKATRHLEFSSSLNDSQVRVLLALLGRFQWATRQQSPQHWNTSRQVGEGAASAFTYCSCGSDQSFLAMKSCSSPLPPSISSSRVKPASSLLQPAKPFLMQVWCIMHEQRWSLFSPFQIQAWPVLLVKSASWPVPICIV